MTLQVLITLSLLILLAYVFELTSRRSRIPSFVLLLALGWLIKQLSVYFQYALPDLSFVLPGLGTIGLILIVLEGSLELELSRSKLGLIRKSFLGAVGAIVFLAFMISALFHFGVGADVKTSLIFAVPLCIISSAIAIPSAASLPHRLREFVIYESSFSDIAGVLLFNFIVLNDVIDGMAVGIFVSELLLMLVISFFASLGLAVLLKRINHHVKFVPIILLVVLIYLVSKIYHLPALVFILLFGLFIGNLDELKQYSWVQSIDPDFLNREVKRFKDVLTEATFVVRVLFFLVFGYLIETSQVFNTQTIPFSASITLLIFSLRYLQLKLSGVDVLPLLFLAPRGLITILLFLSIDPGWLINLEMKSLVIQVVLLSACVMMFGFIFFPSVKEQPARKEESGIEP